MNGEGAVSNGRKTIRFTYSHAKSYVTSEYGIEEDEGNFDSMVASEIGSSIEEIDSDDSVPSGYEVVGGEDDC